MSPVTRLSISGLIRLVSFFIFLSSSIHFVYSLTAFSGFCEELLPLGERSLLEQPSNGSFNRVAAYSAGHQEFSSCDGLWNHFWHRYPAGDIALSLISNIYTRILHCFISTTIKRISQLNHLTETEDLMELLLVHLMALNRLNNILSQISTSKLYLSFIIVKNCPRLFVPCIQ